MACTWPARNLFSTHLPGASHLHIVVMLRSQYLYLHVPQNFGKRTTQVTALYQSLPLFVKARVGPQDYNVVVALIKSLKLLNCFSQPICKTGTWPCADCCLCEYGHGLCAWSSLGFIRAFPLSIPLQLLVLL